MSLQDREVITREIIGTYCIEERKVMSRKNVETNVFYIKVFMSKEEIPNAGLNWIGKPNILGPYQTIQQAREFINLTFATMPSILQNGINVASIYSGIFYKYPIDISREHFIPERLMEIIDMTQEEIHKKEILFSYF